MPSPGRTGGPSILRRIIGSASDGPEDGAREILVLLHGLLMVFAAYAILSGFSGTLRGGAVIILALAFVFQALIYVLPDGYISERDHQRLLIVLGVTITAGWLFPLSLDAEPAAWIIIVLVLVVPLIRQRMTVWVGSTALTIAFVLVGRRLGWLESGPTPWETEFLVVELFLIVWIIYAFLFDSLKSLTRLRDELSHERTQTRVLTRIASSFPSATDARDVFLGVSQALREAFGIERCLMVRADPLQEVGSLVAVSGNSDSDSTGVDLGDGSPLRAALTSGQALYLHDTGSGDPSKVLAITADSGFGHRLIIFCEAPRPLLTSRAVALLEMLADAAVRTIANVQHLGTVQKEAQTDALTGLPNRGSFQSNFSREFERAKRHERPLSLLMIDLDFLKSINDQFGHPMGDAVIRTAAERIVSTTRGTDYLAARYGGEEFAVILPETDMEGALIAAERICEAIARSAMPTVGQFTASIGAACYPVNATTQEGLVQAADEALYSAKRAGRNQVVASASHTLI